jgi:hypothetical protein
VDDQRRHRDEAAGGRLRPLAVELEHEPSLEHVEAVAVLAMEVRARSALALGIAGLRDGQLISIGLYLDAARVLVREQLARAGGDNDCHRTLASTCSLTRGSTSRA